ncbi:hypothetical protein GCM10020295_63290 [Streptomyces cinereospinus]
MTNEKRLLERAGLRTVDGVIASLSAGSDQDSLTAAIGQVEALFAQAVSAADHRVADDRSADRLGAGD